MLAWHGNISLDETRVVEDIHLSTSVPDVTSLLSSIQNLQFLAYVDPTRIPIQLAIAPYLQVHSGCGTTLNWLTNILAPSHNGNNDITHVTPWYETDQVQSSIGVLVKANHSSDITLNISPKITEILFYAVQRRAYTDLSAKSASPLPSQLSIAETVPPFNLSSIANLLIFHALPLSSDLLYKPSHIPPHLPDDTTTTLDTVLSPPPDPKTHLTSLFDAATSRRKRPRRIATTTTTTTTNISHPHIPRPPADDAVREISKTNSRPASRHGDSTTAAATTSTIPPLRAPLNLHDNATATATTNATAPIHTDLSIESRNKQVISRTVMAGMRIHGLSQKTSSRVNNHQQQQHTAADSPAPAADLADATDLDADLDTNNNVNASTAQEDAAREAEYKGVYHQAYKGTVFAFRRDISHTLLPTEAVHDVVDRLLAVFCSAGALA